MIMMMILLSAEKDDSLLCAVVECDRLGFPARGGFLRYYWSSELVLEVYSCEAENSKVTKETQG